MKDKYEDEKYINLLRILARKNSIPHYEFEDFKQDVFLEAMESYAETADDYKKVAYRVARRYGRILKAQKDIDGNTLSYSFNEDRDSIKYFEDVDGEYDSILWEDMHAL